MRFFTPLPLPPPLVPTQNFWQKIVITRIFNTSSTSFPTRIFIIVSDYLILFYDDLGTGSAIILLFPILPLYIWLWPKFGETIFISHSDLTVNHRISALRAYLFSCFRRKGGAYNLLFSVKNFVSDNSIFCNYIVIFEVFYAWNHYYINICSVTVINMKEFSFLRW